MSSQIDSWQQSYRRDDTGWISLGSFLVVVGIIYLTTPNLVGEIEAFLRDFQLVQIYDDFWWFVPSTNHPLLYVAAERFCYFLGILQVGILILRLVGGSSIHGKAETTSSAVFWLGMGYPFSLLAAGSLSWMLFLAVFIVLVGLTIVVRSLILLLFHGEQR